MPNADRTQFLRRPLIVIPALSVVGLAVACLFLAASHSATGEWFVFPLDDTYIHLRMADNWIQGDGFVINPGETASPESSALWGLMLSWVGWTGVPLIPAAMGLSIISYLAMAALIWWITLRLTDDPVVALASALIGLFTGRLVWSAASGMEITLASTLALSVIALHIRQDSPRFTIALAIAGGLAALTRPELALLVAGVALIRWHSTRRLFPWIESAIAAGIFLLYPLHHFLRTGHLLPSTMSARRALCDESILEFIGLQLRMWFTLENLALYALFTLGAIALIKRRPSKASVLWIWIALQLGFALVYFHVSYHHARYLIPLIPGVIIVTACSVSQWASTLTTRPILFTRGIITLPLLSAIVMLPVWRDIYRDNTSNIFHQQITISHWINANIPEGDLLAVNDVGAFTYFTDHPVVDLAGLATPELLPIVTEGGIFDGKGDDQLAGAIDRMGCEWAIFFPEWYPILAERDDLLETVLEFRLRQNTICGDELVRVCRVIR